MKSKLSQLLNCSLLLLIFSLSFTLSYAQEISSEDTYSHELSSATPFPEDLRTLAQSNAYNGIEHISTIEYDDKGSILVQFNDLGFSRSLTLSDSKGISIAKYELENNEVIIENLDLDNYYTLSYTDNFIGETLEKEIFIGEESELLVSTELYDQITEFLKQDETDFLSFLLKTDSVSSFEAYSFYQRFMDVTFETKNQSNKPIFSLSKEFTTPKVIQVNRKSNNSSGCICNVLATQTASPAGSPFVDPNTGEINDAGVDAMNPWVDWGRNSHAWYFRKDRGPAKAHMIWSQGLRSGGDEKDVAYTNINTGTTNLPTPHEAELNYVLLCVGGDLLPNRECECTTNLCLTYGYDSYVHAQAILKSAIGGKASEALSEDMAFVTEHNQFANTTNLLAAGMASVSAACDRTPNPEWFISLIDVSVDVANAIITGMVEPNAIEDFADDLETLITNNAFIRTGSCDVVEGDISIIEGDYCTTLTPNTPMSYRLYSGTNQRVGGRRSWHSQAWNVSNFLISGVAESLPANDICCIDGAASWALGNLLGSPLSDEDLRRSAGAFIRIINPNLGLPLNPNTNGYVLPASIGSIFINGCRTSSTTSRDITSEDNDNLNKSLSINDEQKVLISLHDMTGRKVFDLNHFLDMEEFRNSGNYYQLPIGLYVVRYELNGLIEAEKIFLGK